MKGSRTLRKNYIVTTTEETENHFSFIVNENIAIENWQPASQLIADSDNFALVYLIDDGESYSYLRFEPTVWQELATLMQSEKPAIAKFGEQELVLTGMQEELAMLIFNIEGNNNYGAAFVEAVEEAFAKVLQA